VLLQYYSLLHTTVPVLLCTTKYYSVLSSITPHYKILPHYCSVQQRTTSTTLYYTPVLLCTTRNHSSTTLRSTTKHNSSTTPVLESIANFYAVLQRTYSALQRATKYYLAQQRTTPVLLCTTKYYSVQLQYYSSTTLYNSSTTPVLHCTTEDYNIKLQYYSRTSLYYKYYSGTTPTAVLLCPTKCYSSTSVLQSTTPVILCTTKYSAIPNTARARKGDSPRSPNVAPATKNHTATSPNAAPATKSEILHLPRKNDCHDWSCSPMKRHWQCAEQEASPSDITNYCACHAKLHSKILENLPKTVEASCAVRGLFDHDPSMIRPWTRHLAPARSPRLFFALRRRITTLRAPAIYPDFTKYCACHGNATKSHTATSPKAAPATKSQTPTPPNIAPATKNDSHDWSCYDKWDVSVVCGQMWVMWLMSLDWTGSELSSYLTELLLDWTITLLSCYFTELLFDWAVTLLSCYFTELLFDWAVTLLSCYFIDLLLYWILRIFKSP